MANTVVPILETKASSSNNNENNIAGAPFPFSTAPDAVFFMTDPARCAEISEWLRQNGDTYEVFYASFVNDAIATMQRLKLTRDRAHGVRQEDVSISWLLEEEIPVQTRGFQDAMQAFFDGPWKRGKRTERSRSPTAVKPVSTLHSSSERISNL